MKFPYKEWKRFPWVKEEDSDKVDPEGRGEELPERKENPLAYTDGLEGWMGRDWDGSSDPTLRRVWI